ncbi:hypothetical protein T07_5388 [Trichinella nelsoni]|uniref:Uncharacterized protein n=1 Tax=Trichinella nelsoni TaxID=6336 RepID=A0A0V0SN53_9BILA|nr:hypothetical protein T07_5388 [Trichinella nelsoni]
MRQLILHFYYEFKLRMMYLRCSLGEEQTEDDEATTIVKYVLHLFKQMIVSWQEKAIKAKMFCGAGF